MDYGAQGKSDEGVALLFNDYVWKFVKTAWCKYSRIMFARLMKKRECWIIVSVYAPGMERIWEDKGTI